MHNSPSIQSTPFSEKLKREVIFTCVCKGLDVVGQVDVYTLGILHFLEYDPDEPHGHKLISVWTTEQ